MSANQTTTNQTTTTVESFTNCISKGNSTPSKQDATNCIRSVDSHISPQENSGSEFSRKFERSLLEWLRYEQTLSENAKKTQNVLNNECLLVTAEKEELKIIHHLIRLLYSDHFLVVQDLKSMIFYELANYVYIYYFSISIWPFYETTNF